MLRNLFSKNRRTDSNPYPQSYLAKNKMLIVAIFGVLLLGVPLFISFKNRPDQYTKSATEAARKVIPNAKVKNVRVAGGFAIATVSDPTAQSQIRAGNMTVFKVNEGGSMTQLASASSFSPIDLLELGIPLETQAELMESSVGEVQQNLASACGYSSSEAPGYLGFSGSFNPDEWQIDSRTSDDLLKALTSVLNNKNATQDANKKIICVKTSKNNSNATTDTKTYISTFTLELKFITLKGEISTHVFTFSFGSNHKQTYTLDGQNIYYGSDEYGD